MAKRDEFLAVFVPMAREGKSALEIGKALGYKGEDKKISQKVSNQATQLRSQLKEAALESARKDGLEGDAITERVKEYTSKLPRLRKPGRTGGDLVNMLDEILAKCNETPE